jgi:hypothetical protein
MSLIDKLYKKTKQEGSCFLWTGAVNPSGFPVLNPKSWGGYRYARQLAYALTGNEIKETCNLKSTCNNKLCINPAHLTYEHPIANLLQEFMVQVDMNSDLIPDSKVFTVIGPCWKWTGCVHQNRAYLNKEKWGECVGARWIYKVSNNIAEIPSNITVNHKCNNEICVNPGHLWCDETELVKNKANILQAVTEKRIHNQVFTPEQVKQLRKRILEGEKTSVLCKEFNCSKPTIANIKYNRSFYDKDYTPPS